MVPSNNDTSCGTRTDVTTQFPVVEHPDVDAVDEHMSALRIECPKHETRQASIFPAPEFSDKRMALGFFENTRKRP